MRKTKLIFLYIVLLIALSGCAFIDDFMNPPSVEPDPIEDDSPIELFTLQVESDNNEAQFIISPDSLEYDDGTVISITALDVEGYRFSHWINTATNQRMSSANPLELTINQDTVIEAVYEMVEYFDINVISNVDSTINISGESPYMSLMLYTITAEPLAGYRFEHWIDRDTGLIVSYQETYNFTLNRHRNFEAIYVNDNDYGLYLYSNIDNLDDFDFSSGYLMNSSIELIAPDAEDYLFKHWFDYQNQVIISEESTFTLTMDESYYLIAVYHQETAPRLYYEETFEELTKGTYASGIVQAYGHQWWFEDALIGTLDNDQSNGDRSVRIREGYIELLLSIDDVHRIEFMYGRYLADSDGILEVYLAFDEQDWLLVDTLTTSSFSLYQLDFNDSVYEEFDIDSRTMIAIRLVSPNASRRTNIDDFRLFRNNFFTPEMPLITATGDDLEFPNNSTRVTLSFDDSFNWAYSYQDTWDGSGCIAIDDVLGELECLIDGYVDTSKLGEYTVTYYVIDEDGRYASEVITKVVFTDAGLLDFEYSEYYHGIEGLYGDALIEALREILNDGVTLQTYNDAREILADADVDPNDDSKVLTIYDRQSVERIWDATTWHREHVWPNSRLGIPRVTGTQRNIGSDLHNLRAIIPSVNSSRSNKVFANETTSDTYFPGDQDKGDVARILFYMVVMWDHLELVDEVLLNDPDTNYTLDGARMALLNYLLKWHFEDPVDGFEVHRNEVIYEYQNNRNPFIDYPHLVELIWYDNPAILID